MNIKDIAKMYGKTDYYEMMTGRIFKLSKATYSKETDTTIVPVDQDGDYYGDIKVKGNIFDE